MTIYTIDSLSIPIWTFSCCRRSMLIMVVVVSVTLEFDQIFVFVSWFTQPILNTLCLYLHRIFSAPSAWVERSKIGATLVLPAYTASTWIT